MIVFVSFFHHRLYKLFWRLATQSCNNTLLKIAYQLFWNQNLIHGFLSCQDVEFSSSHLCSIAVTPADKPHLERSLSYFLFTGTLFVESSQGENLRVLYQELLAELKHPQCNKKEANNEHTNHPNNRFLYYIAPIVNWLDRCPWIVT